MEEAGKEQKFTLEDADRLSQEVKFLTPRYQSMVTALAAAAYHRSGAGGDASKGAADVGAPGDPAAPAAPVVPDGSAPEAGDDDDEADVLITVEDGNDLPPVGEVIRHGFTAGKRLGLVGQDEEPDEGTKIGGRLEVTKIGTKIGTRIVVKHLPPPNEL